MEFLWRKSIIERKTYGEKPRGVVKEAWKISERKEKRI